MIPSPTVQDRLRRAFAPTANGVAGLTEQLLGACVGADVEFVRVGDRCVCRWTADGNTEEAVAPLPPAAFRTVLARVAELCHARDPDAVTPYRGTSSLSVPGASPAVVRVAFVNTPDCQQLRVEGVGGTAAGGEGRAQTLDAQGRDLAPV